MLQERLWVVVLESKKTALSVWAALPQTLAYLSANPNSQLPSFGLMTNGDEIVFVKLTPGEMPQYDVSRVFSPVASRQELHSALQIVRHLAKVVGTNKKPL